MNLDDLRSAHCVNLKRGDPVLPHAEIGRMHSLVPAWTVIDDNTRISRRFRFEGFTAATDFISRLVPLANAEDHHPDITLTMYRWVEVFFRTNSIGGLSMNDFIMAAKVDEQYEAFVGA